MTPLFAFLSGVLCMCVSIFCATWVALRLLEHPEVRAKVLAAFLDGIAPYFPAIAIVDIEGAERLIQFSALRESVLRIARRHAARGRDDEKHYDA